MYVIGSIFDKHHQQGEENRGEAINHSTKSRVVNNKPILRLPSAMDAFYRLTTGGSSIESFARDVYIKDHITRELINVINILKRESAKLNEPRQPLQQQQLTKSSSSKSSSPANQGTPHVHHHHPHNLASGLIIPLSETSSNFVTYLISIIEATFLHGLKEKLSFNKITASLLTSSTRGASSNSSFLSSDKHFGGGLETDFWSIIQILSHHQTSDNLNNLSNIYTDIGRCRSWIRMTLNESLIGSYIEALINDVTILSGFYKSNAYFRDADQISRLRKVLSDLDNVAFQLNYDDANLNGWSDDTIKILGFSVPSTEPVITAVDALQDEMKKSSLNSRARGSKDRIDSKSVLKKNLMKKNQKVDQRSDCQSIDTSSIDTSTVDIEVQSVSSSTANIEVVGVHQDNVNCDHASSGDNQPTPRGRTPSINIVSSTPSQGHSHRPVVKSMGNLSNRKSSASKRIVGNSLGNKEGWSSSSSTLNSAARVPENYGNIVTDYISSCEVALSSTPDIRDVVNTLSMSPSSSSPHLRDANISDNNFASASRERQTEKKIKEIIDPPKRFNSVDARDKADKKVEDERVSYLVESKFGNYEVVPKSLVLNNEDAEVRTFLASLIKICPEVGLDQQDYKCKSCGRPIGLIYGKSALDKFDGYHYCLSDCFDANLASVIPSRILFNFDYKKYPVSKNNYHQINLIMTEPLFDIKLLSTPSTRSFHRTPSLHHAASPSINSTPSRRSSAPTSASTSLSSGVQTPSSNQNHIHSCQSSASLLYQMNTDMKNMLDARTQLFYLHGYIFTCAEGTIQELRKIVWPKEHLFEHIHLYSLEDLIGIKNGSLSSLIKRAITFARKHVTSCALCSQKGFICEICKDPNVIFPFDTDATIRCEACHSVYHKSCCYNHHDNHVYLFDKKNNYVMTTDNSNTIINVKTGEIVNLNDTKKVRLPQDCPRCKRIERRRMLMGENVV